MTMGRVVLVGAGPGDLGLMTIKGMESLKRADVIVYDHLIDESLLEWASVKAEKIYAGKTGNKHAKEQSEINQILIDKAKEGKLVVRLKGGDPFVFGRGGEEAEALVDQGIAFEVVPGISSSVAVPAYAGIPVTHRESASSFAVITGHEDAGKEVSSINWEKLATGVDTLIFLMGMKNLPNITTSLMKYGRHPNTAVAVIKDGTRPEQKTVEGTLRDIAEKVKAIHLGPPAVIVVGEVVKLRGKLRWFDNRPLSGKRILVTRARQQASELSRLLSEYGAEAIELPAIDIQRPAENKEFDAAIAEVGQYQWIVFTSVNGVDFFFERIHANKMDTRALKGVKIAAIGPATSKSLELRGISPDYCPSIFTSQALLEGFTGMDIIGQRFLLPRADIADKELTNGLVSLRAEVREIDAYKTIAAAVDIARAKQMIEAGEIDIVTFTSSSTVSNLTAAFGNRPVDLNGALVACIGPKTMEAAEKTGLKVDIIAKEQTIPGLVEAIRKYYSSKERI